MKLITDHSLPFNTDLLVMLNTGKYAVAQAKVAVLNGHTVLHWVIGESAGGYDVELRGIPVRWQEIEEVESAKN